MKKVAILGSGTVGLSLAKGFSENGVAVVIGTRDTGKKEIKDLQTEISEIKAASSIDAVQDADIVVLATSWTGTEAVIKTVGSDNFKGKIVIDVTNPLDFSGGTPPKFALAYPNSGGLQVQEWLQSAKVVKAFNIITSLHMYKPNIAEGAPTMLIAGDDTDAKSEVTDILKQFGWEDVIDMGDITNSYILEAVAMAWINYGFSSSNWVHGWSLLKK